jgi:rSAM/selenodomain-associated transferase 2
VIFFTWIILLFSKTNAFRFSYYHFILFAEEKEKCRTVMAGKAPVNRRISVIIPSLNEEGNLGETLTSVRHGNPFEVVVVDGGSTDKTVEIARSYPGVTITVSKKRGRSKQMNEGARMCSGDIFLFLHADSILPDGWSRSLEDTMEDGDIVGGCYFVKLSSKRFIYRLTGWMINVRTILFQSFSGDQAIFLKSDVFADLGGFPDVPLMEDLMIANSMRKKGKIAFIRQPVTTSSRNWEKWGPVKTIFLMWYMKILFRIGRAPGELATYYRDGKFPPLFHL